MPSKRKWHGAAFLQSAYISLSKGLQSYCCCTLLARLTVEAQPPAYFSHSEFVNGVDAFLDELKAHKVSPSSPL